MAAPTVQVRYSVPDNKDIGDAKNFSWDVPIPVNKFWNDITFVEARNFMHNFSADELAALPIDSDSTLDKPAKLALLLQLLHDKVATQDAMAAPQTWYDVDSDAWDTLQLGVSSLMQGLGRPDAELEAHLRMMIQRNKFPENLSHHHTLAGVLLNQRRYAEAEAEERPVLPWLDSKVGRDSPQSLGARQYLVHAVWKQGREEEARKMFEETLELIEGSREGPYGVYADEAREMTEKLFRDLNEGNFPRH
jgi:tetratricopeptide (TPR) repeat protein